MISSIEFCFDYSSPWAYLANALLRRRFGETPITYSPIYIRGLESFKNGLPYTGAKLQYMARDLMRVAEHEKIEIKIPSNFPINGLYAVRGALVAQREGTFAAYHEAMFRAAWAEDRDVSSKEVVCAIATLVGMKGFEAAIEEPSIKETLKQNTERAVSRGVFGVPAFLVGEKFYWGQDRMEFAMRSFQRANGVAEPAAG